MGAGSLRIGRSGFLTFEQQFSAAAHGLAAVGILALAVTGVVNVAYVALAAVSVLWSFWRSWQGRGFQLESWVANAATLMALGFVLFSVVWAGANPIGVIAEFLLVLTVLKALATKANRDWLQILALSFFQLLAASALTIEPLFAAVFLAYLILGPWTLVLFHLRREITEQGEAERLTREPFVDPSLFRSVAGMAAVLFSFTILVFVMFPRMGTGYFATNLGGGSSLSGFSDEVALGDVTALTLDQSVAMRVAVDRPDALRNEPLYWRGAVLDAYDGKRWSRSGHDARPLQQVRRQTFVTGEEPGRGVPLRQEILLEPMEGSAVIGMGRILEVHGPFTGMIRDALGNLRGISPGFGRKRYEVVSSLTPPAHLPTPASRTLPDAVDPRVVRLARDLTGAASTDAARAEILAGHFDQGFRYTLEPGDSGTRDPLARFLFETREGHCEYFASSLAVMLRSVGIPGRLVNGYRGGEWNDYGDYFVVRQSHAHSWVEAYVDGRWRRFDPTPPGAPRQARSFEQMKALIDSYRMQWYRYVINYGAADQFRMAFSLRSTSRQLWQNLSPREWMNWLRSREIEEGSWSRIAFGGLGLTLIVGVSLLLLGRSPWGAGRRRLRALPWVSRQYLAMLRLLERRGLSKRAGETPDEFLGRIEPRLGADTEPVRRLTRLYQDVRFSGRREAAETERRELEALLASLARQS